MRRLQAKVRDYIQMQQQLASKLQEAERRDEIFMNRLENAVTFGKIMFQAKASIVKTQKQLQSAIHQSYKAELEQAQIAYQRENAGKRVLGWGLIEHLGPNEEEVLE